ncbi:hypothetical protein LBMAG56_47640 [Verrucomicrobiota bacterium]|nr:hypothetical protein LBMAG56_47640 [Verrucomicrobiota bacterium]
MALMEVMAAAALAALVIGGILAGYTQSCNRAEWAGFNFAAQSLAAERFEQTRGCRWDREALTNSLTSASFPPVVLPLDLPVNGQPMTGTNYTTITDLSVNPALKLVRVDCVWRFPRTGRLYTNSMVSYRASDN